GIDGDLQELEAPAHPGRHGPPSGGRRHRLLLQLRLHACHVLLHLLHLLHHLLRVHPHHRPPGSPRSPPSSTALNMVFRSSSSASSSRGAGAPGPGASVLPGAPAWKSSSSVRPTTAATAARTRSRCSGFPSISARIGLVTVTPRV